jgi:hypothetical protein
LASLYKTKDLDPPVPENCVGTGKSEDDGNVHLIVPDYVILWLVENPDAFFRACRAIAQRATAEV